MKPLLLTLLAIALWTPLGARKPPKNPIIKASSSPSSALNVTTHQGKHRTQLTAKVLAPGKGVAEETLKSRAAVESAVGEKTAHQQGGKASVLKNSVLRRKEAAHPDGEKLWKGDGAKKKMTKAGKVLGPKKTETSLITAKPESTSPGLNISLAEAGRMYSRKGAKETGGLIDAKKTLEKEHGASHREPRRKEHATAQRNVTEKGPSPWHRNENKELSSPAHKNASQIKEGKRHRFLHRNDSQAQLQKNVSPRRKSSWSPGKEDGALHRNASGTRTWKHSLLAKNGSQTQREKETHFHPRNASQAGTGKPHGIPSANSSWTQPGQKPGTLQRNTSQAHVNKTPSFTPRSASQELPRKRHGIPHRNSSRGAARKEPSPSHKNTSQALAEERPPFPHRNTTWAAPRKTQGTRLRNASRAEVGKTHRPPHRNNSRALTGTKNGDWHRSSSQAGAGNTLRFLFRNTTQIEAVKERSSPRKNLSRAGEDTPQWWPLVSRERDEPVMPSLPTTCLLSEHAIACGNAHLQYVPKLSDPVLKTLYLAENEITRVPAGIFLGLPSLEWLDLSKNKLDSSGLHPEAFKNLTKLKRLNLDGNRLQTVPALPSSLQEIKLNDNRLEGLQRNHFRGLFRLLTLELEGNQLHDGNVLPTAFKPLTRLTYLRLDRNHFRAIPSGLPASLQELHLDSNHIEEVTEGALNKTLNLTVLVLSNNRLQEDRIAPRAWIDLPKLEALDLSHNHLAHVPSFLPRHLKQLTLHHNRIERIPGYVFAHMKPGLEFLHLSHNVLRDDGIHAVSFLGLYRSLAELLLDNNQLQAIPRGILNLKGLQVLRLSHNRIRHIPLNSVCDTRVAEDSNIISMHLENNLIDRRRIPPTAFSCIKAYHSVVLRPQQNEEDDY